MKIFDSHCHYNDPSFAGDLEDTFKRIRDRGVCAAVNAGADLESSSLGRDQSEKYDFLYFSRGIHPENASEVMDDIKMGELEKLLCHPKAVAVGEAGLDFHYPDRESDELQKEAFIRQIELSNRVNKPLIVHTRDAMEATIGILKENTPQRRVIHCFSGSSESCRILVNMGFYIGFTGAVTFKNAKNIAESLKVVPKDRILIETDCPYMAPVPLRGKRSDSSMLPYTAKRMGEILRMSAEEVLDMTYSNAMCFYNLNN